MTPRTRRSRLAAAIAVTVAAALAAVLVVGLSRERVPGQAAEADPAVPFAVGDPVTIALGPHSPQSVAVTPDGRRVLVGTFDGLAVLDATTTTVLGELGVSGAGLLVSPDGRLAYVGIEPVDLSTGLIQDPLVADAEPGFPGTGVAISGDGQRLFTRTEGTDLILRVVDVATGSVRELARVPGGASSIAVTEDGARAYLAGGLGPGTGVDDLVRVVDTATGRISPVPGTEGTTNVALGPDGRSLYGIGFSTAFALDPATGTVTRSMPVDLLSGTFTVSPGGRYLYVLEYGLDGHHQVQVVDLDEQRYVTTVPLDEVPLDLAVAPDGSALYVTSQVGLTVIPIQGGGA